MASFSPQVRVGVGCFVISTQHPDCILFGERKGSHGAGKLALPGGHLEMGETWEQCAQREVQEETNLEVEDIRFVYVTVRFVLVFMFFCMDDVLFCIE